VSSAHHPPAAGPIIAVDLGGTKTTAGVVDADGQVRHRITVATPAAEGRDAVLAAVVTLVRGLAQAAPQCQAAGIGTAGVVDPVRGVVTASTDAIAAWAGTHVAERVTRSTALPVQVVNDVVAWLHGERAHGAARGRSNVLAVTVGTGVGGALLVDGHVARGHRDVAGHIGHLTAPAAAGRRCSCGRTGHVEAVASGPAMSAEYARRVGTTALALPDVVRREAAGDDIARDVLADAGAILGEALGGLANAVAPELVLLGGGVVDGSVTFTQAMTRALRLTTIPALNDVTVMVAALGSDAALVGAAAVARSHLPVAAR
jgi:glucokinase